MDRRDLSKAIVGIAAVTGVAALAQKAQAQTCTAPCYAQTAAETAAGVTVVNSIYPPGVIDRYGTNTTPGTTDMAGAIDAAIAQASHGGPPVTAQDGVYYVASNITWTAGYVNLQGGNGYIKPASGVVITLTGAIFAGPWKIFDVSNTSASSLQGGTTPIAGPCPIEQFYAEWFGAIGNGSNNDGPAIQAALNFGLSSYGGHLQLLQKTYITAQTLYAGGSSIAAAAGAVAVRGVPSLTPGPNSGTRATVLSDGGHFSAAGTPILIYRCTPSAVGIKANVEHVVFDSTSSNYAIGLAWAGITGSHAIECTFGPTGLYEGIRWWNYDSGTFSEYNIAESCTFWNCLTMGHFFVSSGNVSFHGSGFDRRCVLNISGAGPAIVVDSGASWYNGTFDAQVFGSGFTLFQINDTVYTNISASGRMTLELGTGTVTLAAGGGAIYFTGDIRSNGNNLVPGTLLRCRAMINTDVSAPACIGAERTSSQTLSSGTNRIATHGTLAGCVRKILLLIYGGSGGYQYQYELTVLPQAGNAPAYVVGATGATPVPLVAINSGGWAVPALSGNTDGTINVTISGTFPTGGVTAYMWEGQMSPGTFGGAFAYV